MSRVSCDIGIDLGTTFSVIAVKGPVTLADGYPPAIYLPECDTSIIPAPDGNSTFPSVLWTDPADPSCIQIGTDAKQQADEGEAPIMFSKRKIGTTELLTLHDRTFTAKEVATHILQYLKQCAERALEQPVRRAVVTHPAYFDENQVQETREAAIAAGFDMSLGEQMMMEPAAAALAYTKEVEQDPLLVLTYDLGGGTFDVTVLERNQGVITMRAFDGDHLLGGYNFDRALVQWMVERLADKGRHIEFDEHDPSDRGRRARLLNLAEQVKIRLTEARGPRVAVHVRAPDVLVDTAGKKVSILEEITREQYAALIQEDLDKTIQCCRSALAKAGLTPNELHTVLLVGGSSYGQWVQESVRKAFGREVQLYNPDLCVAAGAALRAAELPTVAAGESLELLVDVPSTSALRQINVTGTVRRIDGTSAPTLSTGLRIFLQTPAAGTLGPLDVDRDGTFLFPDVELLEGSSSPFTIRVVPENGTPPLVAAVSVQYSPDATGTTEIYNVLPKPIYVRTKDGLKPIAEEGEPLPAKCEFKRPRVHDDSTLDIELYRDNEQIGVIEVASIPDHAAAGSYVAITVEITQKNEMRGRVAIESRTGQIVVERPVNIRFPPLRVPELTELEEEFEALEAERQQLEELSHDPEQRVLLAGKGAKLSKKLSRKFAEQMGKDRQEIYASLREFRNFIHPPPDDMNPPRAEFQQLVDACQEILQAQQSDAQFQAFPPMLKRIETDGNDAATTKNHRKWAAAHENLLKLYARLEKLLERGVGPSTPPDIEPTPLLKDRALQVIDALRCKLESRRDMLTRDPRYAARLRPRLDRIATAIDKMDAEVAKVNDNLEARQGLAQVQLAMRPIARLQQEIDQVDVEI